MNSRRAYQIMLVSSALLAILLVVSVWLGTSILRSSADKLQEAKVNSDVVSLQENSLAQANNDIEKYSELAELSNRIIPQEKDQARTVREIINIANQSDISITSITFPASNLGAAQPAPQAGSDGVAVQQAPSITQAKPVAGIPGLLELAITVQVTDNPVTYNQLISFLDNLEQNRRTSQVQGVNITPDANDRSKITFNISLAVFIKP